MNTDSPTLPLVLVVMALVIGLAVTGAVLWVYGGLGEGAKPPIQASELEELENDGFLLVEDDFTKTTPAYLSNGLIGIRLSRFNSGLTEDEETQPLGYFQIEEFQPDGEEKIIQLANPLAVRVLVGGTGQSPRMVRNYRQVLDMKDGTLSTEWTQGRVAIKTVSVVHPDRRLIAQKWTLTGSGQVEVEVGCYGEDCWVQPLSKAGDSWIYPVSENGGTVVQILDVSGGEPQDQGDKRTIQVEINPEEPLEFEVLLASPISPNAENVAQAAGSAPVTSSTEEVPEPFDAVLSESLKIWNERWKTDIEIDGPTEDQLAVRSFLFYLRSSIHPDGQMSVSPFALSETMYNGHVFWDADVWVLPALLMLDPQRAQTITRYRIDRFPAAAENFQQALSRFPLDGPNPWRDPNPRSRVQPVQYPWESSVSGLETAPGNSRSQHHISGSVLWGLDQAAALGLVDQRTLQQVGRSVAEFYRLRAERGESGALEILGTMSPDEFKIADNDLYTNILAEWAIRTFGPDPLTTFKLPRDSKSLLTYENDELRGHKQAAGILAVYPLQHHEAERAARTLLQRFKPAVIDQGPAMTDSIHAIVEARLRDREQAYATWQDSWKQFAHHPLLIFSEKRANDRGYFTTGAGGSLQTVLYGFGGMRIDDSPLLSAGLTLPLRNGKHLNVLPSLPPAWKRVTFKNLILPDQRLTLEMDQSGEVRRIAEEN